jgi:RND family efflux transporter MFP subunit
MLAQSAKRKLRLWGIAEEDIEEIARSDKPPATIPIRSPATGHIEDKTVVQGSPVVAMSKVMRVVDHSQMWLEAQVYQNQMNSVKEGQRIRATVEGMPGKQWEGAISFLYPHVDHMSRTLTVRMTIANSGFHLKPGMYATAEIALDPMEAMQVPREAVIDTGERQIAFVDSGDGHFEARKVQMGIAGDGGMVQILTGLAPGEAVVTSGQFLLDAESRTVEAIATMGGSAETMQHSSQHSKDMREGAKP